MDNHDNEEFQFDNDEILEDDLQDDLGEYDDSSDLSDDYSDYNSSYSNDTYQRNNSNLREQYNRYRNNRNNVNNQKTTVNNTNNTKPNKQFKKPGISKGNANVANGAGNAAKSAATKEVTKEAANKAVKESAKKSAEVLKKKVVQFIAAHPEVLLIIGAVILIIILIIFIVILINGGTDDTNPGQNGFNGATNASGECMPVSIEKTNLSKDEFINYVNEASSSKAGFTEIKENAGKIYDMSIDNNINPEFVVVRAFNEGFSPGTSSHNYWGLGCCNTCSSCNSYSTFDEGLLSFFEYVHRLSNNQDDIFTMMSSYAYIGDTWLIELRSDLGGCYYYPYIKEYMTPERSEEVNNACNVTRTAIPTTEDDQLAYTKWQVNNAITSKREEIFHKGADTCDPVPAPDDISGNDDLQTQVLAYAISTFDSFSYSQSRRHDDNYVDCSSLVSRAYQHFGLTVYTGWDDTGGEYKWCEENNKLITNNDLKPGDLIFWSDGNPDHYGGTYHVALYAGIQDGVKKQFAAHTFNTTQENQVSVSNYNDNGSYFCRPTK